VLVSYSDNVVMEASLDAALSRIFGGAISTASAQTAAPGAPEAMPAPAATPGQAPRSAADLRPLIQEANQHYERAQQLLRQGDWAGYGEEIKKLGEVLKRMPARP